MTVNFAGHLYNDAGSAVNGASVKLLETGTTTQEGSTVTTDSNGAWAFTESDQDRYDVEITSGSSVRRIRWDDQISLKELDVRNNTGATTPAATLTNLTDAVANQVAVFSGANATRADGDEIYLSFKLANSAGDIEEFARITAEAVDVTDGSEDGQLRFGVAVANGTITDVFTINSSTGGAATISYEVDSFTIKGGEGEAGVLYLFADQGDDAGDEWKVNVADGGVLTIGNDIASAGTYVTFLTLTPHATTASSTVAIVGDATVGDDLSLTSDSSVFNMGAGNDFTITHDGTTGATLAGNPITITSAAAATWSTSAGVLTIDGDDGIVLQTTGSGDVTSNDNVVLVDSAKLSLGTGSDSQIYYDGTDTFWDLRSTGTGDLMMGFASSFPSPDPGKLHIWSGNAGSVASRWTSGITMEDNTNHALEFLQPDANYAEITWGEPSNDYYHNITGYGSGHASLAGLMTFRAAGGTRLTMGALGIHLGSTAVSSGASNCLVFTNGSAETTHTANAASLYAKDVNSSGEMFAVGEDETESQIS